MRIDKNSLLHLKLLMISLYTLLATDAQEIIEEEPNGPIDFSGAKPDGNGNLCVVKTQMIETIEKQQVKECWTQNVTQCHNTYVTDFLPVQEKQCEDNFWKACKITFKDKAYNATLTTCMTPLVRECSPQPGIKPKTLCKTWFETVCNTTYNLKIDPITQQQDFDPLTWCEKIPQKICTPDHCKMVPGREECHDKIIQSTIKQPTELCDLRPSKQCKLVTNLVPHLNMQKVCREIPKEVCHVKDDLPKVVKKPQLLKWCTRPPQSLKDYGIDSTYPQNSIDSEEGRQTIYSNQPPPSPAPYKDLSSQSLRNFEESYQAPVKPLSSASDSYDAYSAPTGYGIPLGDPLLEYEAPNDFATQKRSSSNGETLLFPIKRLKNPNINIVLRKMIPEFEKRRPINENLHSPPGFEKLY